MGAKRNPKPRIYVKTAKLLLAAGADPYSHLADVPDYLKESPLFPAASHKHEAMVRMLVKHKAHIGVLGEINANEIGYISLFGGNHSAP